jgi:hypothetical protein
MSPEAAGLIDLTAYDLTVRGHPIVAMTLGVAGALEASGFTSRDEQGDAVRRLAVHAIEPLGISDDSLFVVRDVRTLDFLTGAPVSEVDLWFAQNRPHDQYVAMWPTER